MSARFDHAGGSVVFSRAPLYGQGGLEVHQAQAESAGGDRFAADPAFAEKPLTLNWSGMSIDEAEALENFMRNVVDGMAEDFIYTAADGSEYIVCFAAPGIDRSEIARGREQVTIQLMQV